MRIKHNKFRNTGVLFELLVRQIASDTLANTDSKAVKIVKKFFTNSELAKEHKLYHTILTAPRLSEGKAEVLVNTTVDMAKKLNKEQLLKEKYNLIKEVKKHYDLESFFKSKVNNYNVLAAAYTLFEVAMDNKFVEPKQVVINKLTILEHITKKQLIKEEVTEVAAEFNKEDKNVRLLAYRMLIEKFNSKYANLSTRQKSVLKEFINNISNPEHLKVYINENLNKVKTELTTLVKQVDDKTTQIKLNEVISLIKPISNKSSVKDEHLVTLLQYQQLAEEIKSVNG
jgi:replicative DNA helicase